jgi:hypothetical protein
MHASKILIQWLVYTGLAIVCLVCWIPSAFELTAVWGKSEMLNIENPIMRKALEILPRIPKLIFLIPFIIAYAIGYFNGRESLWKIVVCGFVGAIGYDFAVVWDTNVGVAGGFSEYGNWLFLVITTLFFMSVMILLAWLATRYKAKSLRIKNRSLS